MADWREQSLRLWQNLGKRERYLIIGSAVMIFIAILAWSYWWGGKPDLVPLFTNLDAKDAGDISAKLKESKVSYEIGNNGSTILVLAKDVYRVRLELASQGLPRGNKGFEIFDQNKFGTTEFQNKVYLVQALQGELARTIEQMAEVEKARVHIVLPEDSLYKKNEKPASASIMLKLKPSVQLSREQVRGIVNLVAHSIQGLKPENITVVDSLARVLNEQVDSDGAIGTGTLTQLEMTKKVQDNLQKSIQSLLEQVLGPGKAAARVNVELNFDQRTVDKLTFEPVTDEKGIIRSSQELNENYKGNSSAPGGPAGTSSNIPGYVTSNNNNNQSSYEKKEVTRNYEINETKEKVVVAPGSIKRLSVAVLVDANITKEQQDSIGKTVTSAIGINLARGDTLSVESIPFNTELADKQRKDEEEYLKQQNYYFWFKVGLVVIGLLLLGLLIRSLVSRRRNEEEELAISEVNKVKTEQAAISVNELSPREQQNLDRRKAVDKIVKNRPEEVAQLIRAWLADD